VLPGTGAPVVRAQVKANDVEDGRLLYVQTCASCHGDAGQGTSAAPALTNSGPAALDFYMRTGRMPLGRLGTPPQEQPPTLSAAQIAAITAYASSFSQGPQIPAVTTGADLSRGWQLYVNNCAACHGASGDGGSVGAGMNAPSLLHIDPVGIAEAMLIGPGPMPKFNLPQDQVNAIASYVESLRNPVAPGGFPLSGSGPVPEGIIAALFGVVLLIVIARWVARRDRLPPVGAEIQGAHGEEIAE
jgi:ubiquinol-cytochrome c reductase cytochrome c subunit